MLKFFGFGRAQPVRSASPGPVSVLPNTLQHTNVQRELVRVVLKDTLRLHGIPAGWVSCEVTVMSRRTVVDELFVHLIIMKWNEALLRFMPALQRQLIQDLDRFDPAVDHSNYIVSWRFSPECECPVTRMPDPAFWTQTTQAVPATSTPKPKFDLPSSDRDNMPSNFAPTEPGPLR